MSDFENDFKQSTELAKRAAPIIKHVFAQIPNLFDSKEMSIYQVEKSINETLKFLDNNCGIDYFISTPSDGKTVSFAWRIGNMTNKQQDRHGVYNSFSLRLRRNNDLSNAANCEIEKRLEALRRRLLYPLFAVQLNYNTDRDELLSLGVARTEHVFEVYEKGLYRECDPHNENKEVFMRDVHWKVMEDNGYPVYQWYAKEEYKLCKLI